MSGSSGRRGRVWAIVGAFAGQAVIIAGSAALLTGSASRPADPATSRPAATSGSGPIGFTLSMDGQTASTTVPQGGPPGDPGMPVLTYMVSPGEDLTATITLTIPPSADVTSLTFSLYKYSGPDSEHELLLPVYQDPARPLAPGQHSFRLRWAGSASLLQAGGQFWLCMTTDGWGRDQWDIASINVS
jgi:hypothetical protein